MKPIYALSFDGQEVYIDESGDWWLNHTRDTKLLLFRSVNQMEKFIENVKKDYDTGIVKRIKVKIGTSQTHGGKNNG